MSTRVFTDPRPSIKLSDGVTPNALGKVYFFEPGEGNTTPKSVFTNSSLTIAATNPVILNGSGQTSGDIYLDGDYRVVIKTSAGGTLYDSPSYQRSVAAEQYGEWTSFTTYAIKDIVRGTDGNYYQSLSSNNNGNNPVTTTGKWIQILFISEYSSLKTYNEDEVALYNNEYYKSLTNNNTGNTPATSRANWDIISRSNFSNYDSAYTYVTGDVVSSSGTFCQSIAGSTGSSPTGTPLSDPNWHYFAGIFDYNRNYEYSLGDKVFAASSIYKSRINGNVGNTPSASPTEWESIIGPTLGRTLAFKNDSSPRASTTTLTADPDLNVTLNGGFYKVYCVLSISADSATPGFKFALDSLAGTIGQQALSVLDVPAASANVSGNSLSIGTPQSVAVSTSLRQIIIYGSISILATGTDIFVSWAQNTSSTDSVYLELCSCLEFTYLGV